MSRIFVLSLAAFLSFNFMVQAEEVAPGVLRTPDKRFSELKDYPYAPNYFQIGDYRIHYIDEGDKDAVPVILFHGEPTWSYLYRKMIPILTAAGFRVIAPDLVGFGKSDKPMDEDSYSHSLQVDTMVSLLEKLKIKNATVFGQDWGGLVGLRVLAAQPHRFSRAVVSNTGLPSAEGLQGFIGYSLFKAAVWWQGPLTLKELQAEVSFPRWVAYSYYIDDLPIGEMMRFMGANDDVVAAYEAPFPEQKYKAGAQIMPYLVPSELRKNAEAWRILSELDIPFLVAFTDSDPITKGGEKVFIERLKNTKSVTIKGAGHFVQEDAGEELAELMVEFMQ